MNDSNIFLSSYLKELYNDFSISEDNYLSDIIIDNKNNIYDNNKFIEINNFIFYYDDLIILLLLIFVYTEGLSDFYLFVTLFLLLIF